MQSEAQALRAELGALRASAERARRAKDGLCADNTRLTHRISYLEDQVAELLARHPQVASGPITILRCIENGAEWPKLCSFLVGNKP